MSVLLLLAAVIAQAPDAYRDPATWLCRPGRADACADALAVTVVAPNGTTRVETTKPAKTPAADCFYAYPTTSMDPTPHSDMIPGVAERGMVASQAAPLRDVCRVFAPIYRQVTLPALRAAMAKSERLKAEDFDLPYADILAAWRDYLAHDNHGRPFVLIGHSQGAKMLQQLLIAEIDGRPIERQMLSAILPGTSVVVRQDGLPGGELRATPLCRAPTQTGCVVTWASYRDTNPPPANALFGRAPDQHTAITRLESGCTNPARLEGGPAPLDPLLGFPWWRGGVAQFQQPAAWTAKAAPLHTRFVRTPGLLSAECVRRGTFTYLAVHVTPGAAADLDAAAIGTAAVGDAAYPDWGFHVVDMAIVMGDLARLVGQQSAAWHAAHRSK